MEAAAVDMIRAPGRCTRSSAPTAVLSLRYPSSRQRGEPSTARPVSRSTGPHEETRSDRPVHFDELFVQFVLIRKPLRENFIICLSWPSSSDDDYRKRPRIGCAASFEIPLDVVRRWDLQSLRVSFRSIKPHRREPLPGLRVRP